MQYWANSFAFPNPNRQMYQKRTSSLEVQGGAVLSAFPTSGDLGKPLDKSQSLTGPQFRLLYSQGVALVSNHT